MGTADRTRQYLSAYRSAFVVGAIGVALVTTAGIAEEDKPSPKVVADGHTVTPPPVVVTETATATVTATPSSSPTETSAPFPSSLPSQLPSSVPSAIASPTPTPSATPTLTPSPTPTLTPRNRANGLKPPVCIIAIDHHGQVIKRPCKETP